MSLKMRRSLGLLFILIGILYGLFWLFGTILCRKHIDQWIQRINQEESFRILLPPIKISGWPGQFSARLRDVNIINRAQCQIEIPSLSLRTGFFFPFQKTVFFAGHTDIKGHCFGPQFSFKGTLRSGRFELSQNKIHKISLEFDSILLASMGRPFTLLNPLNIQWQDQSLDHVPLAALKIQSGIELWSDYLVQNSLRIGVDSKFDISHPYSFLSHWVGFQKWQAAGGQINIDRLDLKFLGIELQAMGKLGVDESFAPQGLLNVHLKGWKHFLKLIARYGVEAGLFSENKLSLFKEVRRVLAQKEVHREVDVSCLLKNGYFFLEETPLFPMMHIFLP